MPDYRGWRRVRDYLGWRLTSLFRGKSTLGADTEREVPRELLEARKSGQLPQLPEKDLYSGSGSQPGGLGYGQVRQELAPLTFNPFGFENPQRVVAAITAHMSGQFQQSGLLSQALLSDPKIFAPLSIRSNALIGLPVEFTPPDDSPDAKDLADLCRANWRRWFPPGEQAKFHRDLITMGFTRAQLIFTEARRTQGSKQLFRHPRINTWMPGQYVWWYWDPARNFGRWLQSDTQGVIEPVPGDGQWVFATMSQKQPWVEGLILSLGLRYAMRLSIALSMVRFATALASGHNVYSGPVQLDGRSLGFIQSQLSDPNNLNLLLPSGGVDNHWTTSWVGPVSGGAKELFLGALEEHGMECSEAILGQNLSTEIKKGSFAAAKASALVRQDVLEFDADLESSICYEQVLRPVAVQNYADADLAPLMRVIAAPATDQFLRAKALHDLAFFLQSAPPSVDRDALLQLYDVPLRPQALDEPEAFSPPASLAPDET